MKLWNAPVDKIAIENPIPMRIFGLPEYSQIIQPYMFGDEYMKTTCLWLKNIPGLFATDIVVPTLKWVASSDHRAEKRKDAWSRSGHRTAKQRSKTSPGIAKAMSEQWG